ncbi:EAL domain-containing protein [Marinobacterium maritimum]|uniref:EAL domain-containing protein n=1 Tax=Marinobacterium maritimum TaxID=500162 RepID=A0ABP3TDQ7_9GAMM
MAALKRNLWTLFWLILLGGIALLAVILHARWQSIYDHSETYHRNRAVLVSQAVDNILRTQELVLDVVGRELIHNEQMFDSSLQLPLLDHVLSVDKSAVGFGLARPDGTLVRVSSNLDLAKLPNLSTHPSTAAAFAQALESKAMVLGRTYFMPALDSWVIPIRKALRNEAGEAIAVMTAGLRMDSSDTVFAQALHDGPDDSVVLYREVDGYLQFISSDHAVPEAYNDAQNSLEQREVNRGTLEAELGISIEELKATGKVFSFSREYDGIPHLTATVFNDRYQLWVISDTHLAPMQKAFWHAVLPYLLTFVVVTGVLFACFRIIDRAERARRAELLYHSTHDSLTGFFNRAGLLDCLSNAIEQQKKFSLVIINIDHFRGVNDRFGQEVGDQTLVEFSRRLKALLDSEHCLARLGGDEFVVSSPNTDLTTLKQACHTLVEQLSQSIQVGRHELQLTASIGMATYPAHGDSASKLLRSAHLALYKAKHNRNAVSLYKTEMEMDYLRQLVVEQRLRQALSENGLHMMYQPQMDENGHIVGLEALVRWEDEELGFVSPAEFVQVAEQSGLMLPLGHFVMDTSLREYSKLREQLGHGLDLAINISVIQFEHPSFVEDVLCLLRNYHIPPQELVLEITESLVMTNFDQVLLTIKRLQRQGIRLSMDDFGTGYSSLSLLRDLPIDELKIDKSFVDNMLDDPRAANMIQSILYIARGHNMDVVVEGVELEAQASELALMGCRRFQGYYFSRPERLERIQEMCLVHSKHSRTAEPLPII